jgi:hypothetical protein
LAEFDVRLVAEAAVNPILPRSAPPRLSGVLEKVPRVLEKADRPMRAHEIHTTAECIAGKALFSSSVKGILSAHTIGGDRRFHRIGHGWYEQRPDRRKSEPERHRS